MLLVGFFAFIAALNAGLAVLGQMVDPFQVAMAVFNGLIAIAYSNQLKK